MSPSGIQADSPLQRTWMILLRNGSSASNAAHVFGAASRSQRARNSNGPAVIFRSLIGRALSLRRPRAPGATRPSANTVRPRSSVRTTRPRSGRPANGFARWRSWRLGRERALAQVDEREVGVGARLEPALAAAAAGARGRAGHEVGEHGDGQPAAQCPRRAAARASSARRRSRPRRRRSRPPSCPAGTASGRRRRARSGRARCWPTARRARRRGAAAARTWPRCRAAPGPPR